jgi:hypothetical protein
VKLERKARTIASRQSEKPEASGNSEVAPLGVSLGGDLPLSWRAGKYVVLPDHAARLPELAIGQSGAGKSTYIGRRVYLAAGQGRQVIAFDGKGDRGFVQDITDAYLAAQPHASVHVFDDQPLDGWRGDAAAQVNRLLGTWQWSLESDWYKQQATLALRLACSAPGKPVGSMVELLERMWSLERLLAKQPTERHLVEDLKKDLPSIRIRLANLAAAIGGRLDGTTAIGEADLTIVSLPVMAHPEDAESLFRILMADVGHWVSVRKTSRPAFLVVDEFSAVSGGRGGAIHVMERGRSFGVPSLLSGQSYASLGGDEDRDRIVSAAATIALFASNSPDDLSRLAGSVQTMESVLQSEDGRFTGRASVTTRARHRVDPNSVRQLQPGQAVVVSGGRAERMQVIQAPGANNDLALPRRPFAVASRVPARLQPRQGQAPTGSATPSLDPPGSDPARGHRPPGASEEPAARRPRAPGRCTGGR